MTHDRFHITMQVCQMDKLEYGGGVVRPLLIVICRVRYRPTKVANWVLLGSVYRESPLLMEQAKP